MTPNLSRECERFFEEVAAARTPGPGGCTSEVGRTIDSADQLRNCMYDAFNATFGPRRQKIETDVAASIGPFTPADLAMYHCAEMAWGKPRDACISAIATSSGDSRLCLLTSLRRCDPP